MRNCGPFSNFSCSYESTRINPPSIIALSDYLSELRHIARNHRNLIQYSNVSLEAYCCPVSRILKAYSISLNDIETCIQTLYISMLQVRAACVGIFYTDKPVKLVNATSESQSNLHQSFFFRCVYIHSGASNMKYTEKIICARQRYRICISELTSLKFGAGGGGGKTTD